MEAARRTQLLQTLGVDLYVRRIRVEEGEAESPVETLEVTKTEVAQAPEPDQAAPDPVAAVPEHEPMTLSWWQFDDLLILEQTEAGTSPAPDCHPLAAAIATALGRKSALQGELHWPPGGDPRAIPADEFVRHFVQGRKDALGGELQLVLASDQMANWTAKLASVYLVPSLQAMLQDSTLKAEAWKTLKALRRQ